MSAQTGTTFDVGAGAGISVTANAVALADSVAGNGLTFNAGVVNAVGTANRISVSADAIDIASTYVGQTSITTLGNVSLNRGTFSNGSVWINNGVNNNGYNENIRLFNAPNGVSVIAFSASGTSGEPTTSLLGYSDRFERRYLSNWQDRMYNGYLEASGSYRAPIFYDSNDTGYYVNPNATSNVNAMVSYSYQGNGNVGGTGSASWHPSGIYSAGFNWLYGGINAGGDIVAYSSSDIRLKNNIKPIENALQKISKISGNTYDWKAENKIEHGYEGNDVGVIAQEIEEVLPQLVQTRENGYKAVKYDKLVALLIEGIKEQQIQINELKAQIGSK